jgi:hypothetical protein
MGIVKKDLITESETQREFWSELLTANHIAYKCQRSALLSYESHDCKEDY